MRSWCDKLASVPTVGFTLDWQLTPGANLLSTVAPFFDAYTSENGPEFEITKYEPLSFVVQTRTGYQFTVDPSKIVVQFQHQMQARSVSGGSPVMEMLSGAGKYTDMLPEMSTKLLELTFKIPGISRRKIRRIGVVSTTLVTIDEAPPGIISYLEKFSEPWGGISKNFSVRVMGDLEKTAEWTQRCIHNFVQPEESDEPMIVTLDWQRLFIGDRIHGQIPMRKILDECCQNATAYFERLGDGSMFINSEEGQNVDDT